MKQYNTPEVEIVKAAADILTVSVSYVFYKRQLAALNKP